GRLNSLAESHLISEERGAASIEETHALPLIGPKRGREIKLALKRWPVMAELSVVGGLRLVRA
ncbi:MAG: hypothetical protein ACRDIB_00325, partial [Ardenticatenaceae bacterium]